MSKLGKTTVAALADELEKISGLERITGALSRAGHNVGQALGSVVRPRQALREGWNATFHPGGKPLSAPWKTMMGLSLASGAASAVKKDDPTGMGHSRLRRTTRLVGDQVGGIMGAPFGFAGGLATSMVGAKVGDKAGALADRIRGYKPRPAAAPTPTLPPRPQGLNG